MIIVTYVLIFLGLLIIFTMTASIVFYIWSGYAYLLDHKTIAYWSIYSIACFVGAVTVHTIFGAG